MSILVKMVSYITYGDAVLIISNRSEIKIDTWMYRALVFEIVLSIFSIFAFAVQFFKLPPRDTLIKSGAVKEKSGFSLDGIALESTPFALISLHHSKLIPPLDAEVVILGRNTRPDAQTNDSNLLIGLRSAKQKKLVENGEKIYLHYDETGEFLSFSENKTALSFRPLILDMDSVLLEAHIVMKDQKGVDEKAQFIIKDQNIGYDPIAISEEDPGFLKGFKMGKFFGKDLFLESYGDEVERGNYKVRMSHNEDSYLYVHSGSFFIFLDEQWQIPEKGMVLKTHPIAKVLDLREGYMDCVVWDPTGYHRWHLKIPREAQPSFKPKIEEIITAVRLRTRSQVSLRLGKNRATVKEGDWFLKTEQGWKKLRKLEEIEEYLDHKLVGDLIVFEKIERKSGEFVLTGSCFDPKRIQVQKIAIPIALDKKGR